jgi:hypothetical protein
VNLLDEPLGVLEAHERLDSIPTGWLGLARMSAITWTSTAVRYFGPSPMWSDERAENPAGQQELQVCRKPPFAVPAEAVVKELPPPRTQEGEDVFEVGSGTRRGAKRRRIEWASPRGQENEARETAADLEATRAEVLVRQAITCEVEDWSCEERRESRPARGSGGRACCHV